MWTCLLLVLECRSFSHQGASGCKMPVIYYYSYRPFLEVCLLCKQQRVGLIPDWKMHWSVRHIGRGVEGYGTHFCDYGQDVVHSPKSPRTSLRSEPVFLPPTLRVTVEVCVGSLESVNALCVVTQSHHGRKVP